jgi:hypothetical protein
MSPSVLQSLHAAVDQAFAERSAELAQRAIELDHREATIAAAAERYSLDGTVSAAVAEALAADRQRIMWIIDQQLEHLPPKAAARIILTSLKQHIEPA